MHKSTDFKSLNNFNLNQITDDQPTPSHYIDSKKSNNNNIFESYSRGKKNSHTFNSFLQNKNDKKKDT